MTYQSRKSARLGAARYLSARGAWISACLLALLVAAGCSSSSQSSTKSAGTPSGKASASSDTSSPSALASLYTGTDHAPSGAPLAAAPGKHIAVISCGLSVSSCADPARAAMDAAKAIGWQATLYDGKLTPAGLAQALSEAMAQKVDGIAVMGFDCDFAPAGFAQAKQAHIPVVDAFGNPACGNGEVGYTGVPFSGYPKGTGFIQGWSRAKADYLVAKLGTNAKVLNFDIPDVPVVHSAQVAFTDEMNKKCPACVVYQVPFPGNAYGPRLQQIAQEAVLQHPDANAVVFQADGHWLGGIDAGIQASGQIGRFNVIAGEGNPAVLRQLGDTGKTFAALPYSSAWAGWGMVDSLNSLFHGKAPRDSGLGWQLVDASHLPKTGPGGIYQPPVDYQADYKKLWGK